MISSMGFDIISAKSGLNWNVTRGKRTRRSMARSMNGVATGGNLLSPRGGGDFSGSDYDKVGEVVTGQSTSANSESIPIKKRRHLLQPPSPLTWAGDFSGIELLAAAASMDEFIDDAKNGNLSMEHSLNLKNPDTSSSAPHCEEGLETNESEISLSNMTLNGGNTDDSVLLSNSPSILQSACGKSVDVSLPKVNRRHWDLNALMETWDMPYDDSLTANTSNDEMHIEDMKKDTCSVARDLSDKEDTETDAGEANPDQILCGGSLKADNAMYANALVDTSALSNLFPPSGGLMCAEGKISVAMNQGEDCSSNLSESERTTSSVIQTASQDIDANHMPPSEISETAMDVKCKDIKDSWRACETSGAIIQGGQSVLSSDSRIQGHVEQSEVSAGHEGNKLPNEGSSRSIALEDSCKSSVGGGQYGDPTSSTGKIGSSFAGPHDSDVSQNLDFETGDGDGLTKYYDMYDSSYEDGELRGSFLYSWEENELDDDYVDYESDGRNGDDSDAAENLDSATFEGGSGVSDGTQKRNPFTKQSPKGNGCKSGSVKQYLDVHFVKGDSDNNERAGKGSTAGSGTTVEEEPMDMNIKTNADFMKGRCLSDRRVMADARMAQMSEYELNTVRGKLESRIEGWSSLDTTHGKNSFMQERRCRFNDLHSRPERDTCPDKHMGRYRLPTRGDRDEAYHSTSWISRRRYSSCQAGDDHSYSRQRNIIGASDKMGGPGFHDSTRLTSIYSKGLDRPVMRSPEGGRVDYFVTRSRRLPPKRGAVNYRSRGHYLHCAGRDFVEHFEPLHEEANIPVQLSHYLSTKEQSFSPVSRRSAHIGLPCKRSLSKSRTGSPGPWHSHKEQLLRSRQHSRSPDFRSEARIERTRMPFPKHSTPNFEEGYISPSRRHFSPPQRNYRWVDNGGFANNHSGHNKSQVRVFRQRSQRFYDTVGSGQMKSDESFRPIFCRRRVSFTTNRGRGYTLESNYDDWRHGDSTEMMHRGPHPNDNGYVRRFRHNVADDFETGSLNFEDVRATKQRNVPQIQGDRDEESS